MSTETAPERPGLLRRLVTVADAFAAPHGIDRYVEQVFPTWSTTEVRGRIVAVDLSAASAVVLTIAPNRNWTGFRAGQYTQLTVEIDGVRHTRCYSMSSAAGRDGTFELAVKAHPHGLVSRHLVANAAVGQVVGLTPAAGDFHLPDERPHRVLLVSGGSGITPVMAMLRTLCDEGHDGPITFLHYARSPHEQVYRAELAALADAHPELTVVLGYDETPEVGHVEGLLDESHLEIADPRWREAEVYTCGPAPLMDAVRSACEAVGRADAFHQEAFTLATALAEAGSVAGTVSFTASDLAVEHDGRPVLDVAEAAGLTPTSGCRMGICHTCVRSLTCGTVRDVVTGDVTTVDPSTGSSTAVRVCVSAPVGDVEIDL